METLRKEAVKISAQLTFEIDNQTITRTDSFKVVAKSQNYLYASFTFSAEWEDITKIAVFKSSCDSYEIYLDENDECVVPWESLMHAGNMYVSVFGGDRITTNKARVPVYATGYTENVSTTQDPTIDVYTSLINRMDNIDDHIDDSVAAALEDAKESGEFDGPKGDKGDKGDTGEISEAEFEAGLATKSNASTIAPEFSASTAYTAGSYVYKNGVLYRFTAAHSGAWTGTDAETVTVGGELTRLDNGSDSGLTEDIKVALLACFEKVAWIDEDGQDYYDALYNALYRMDDLVSISAVYTQSGTVYDTDTLESLRTDLVVTAHMNDGTAQTVERYTLSGTLADGTSTITVSYGEKTTTFNVTVTAYAWVYKADSQELLSEQSYITTSTGGSGGTESIIDGALRLRTEASASSSTSNFIRFTFSDETTEDACIRCKAKIVDAMTPGAGSSAFRLQLSNGTSGAQVYFASENNLITCVYYEGTTRKTAETPFLINEYHVFELVLSNGHQAFTIDGTEIFDSSTLSRNYCTANAILNQANITTVNPNGTTTYIEWIGYEEVT